MIADRAQAAAETLAGDSGIVDAGEFDQLRVVFWVREHLLAAVADYVAQVVGGCVVEQDPITERCASPAAIRPAATGASLRPDQ